MNRRSAIILLTIAVLAVFLYWTGSPDGSDKFGEAIKTLLRPVFHVYLDVFSQQLTAVFFSAAMIIAAILIWLSFRISIALPLIRASNHCSAGLSDILRNQSDSSDPLQRIAMLFSREPLVTDLWLSYRASVYQTSSAPNAYRSSEHARDVFSAHNALADGPFESFYRHAPGYFTGIGIVLTFLGLVAGLYFAARGMRTLDVNEARAALTLLLNSSTLKFLTSVTGILCSMILAHAFRQMVNRIGQEMRQMRAQLETLIPYEAPSAAINRQTTVLRELISCMERRDTAATER